MTDPRLAVGELWRDLQRLIQERFRATWRGNDLHPGAIFLLRHLQREPGISVSELARRAGVVKSGVSKIVDQLSQMEFVEKRQDPDDQRLLRLFLTEAGAVKIGKMEAKGEAAWLSIIEQISPDDLVHVEKGLRILKVAVTENACKADRGDERS